MHVDAPVSLVVATYSDRDAAVRDLGTVWAARADGGFHHTCLALLTRDLDDDLQVELTVNTAEHLLWGPALVSGPVFLLAPAAGAGLLSDGGLVGVGAITGHIRQQADRAALANAAGLLSASTTGLVVVAVNRRAAEMTELLGEAGATSRIDLSWGDLEDALSQDLGRPLSDMALLAG
jgi:hypothetical protein